MILDQHAFGLPDDHVRERIFPERARFHEKTFFATPAFQEREGNLVTVLFEHGNIEPVDGYHLLNSVRHCIENGVCFIGCHRALMLPGSGLTVGSLSIGRSPVVTMASVL